MYKKRGLSPVIATVLLVALVLVLASIIFIWARSFISEQIEKNGKSVDQVCDEVDFDVEAFPSDGSTIDVRIVNRGNVAISEIDVEQITGGSSSTKTYSVGVDAGETLPSKEIPIVGNPTEIVIYPRILGTVKGKQLNMAVVCTNKGKLIEL